MVHAYSEIDNIESLLGPEAIAELRDKHGLFGAYFNHAMYAPTGCRTKTVLSPLAVKARRAILCLNSACAITPRAPG
jgi:hypothetical protein